MPVVGSKVDLSEPTKEAPATACPRQPAIAPKKEDEPTLGGATGRRTTKADEAKTSGQEARSSRKSAKRRCDHQGTERATSVAGMGCLVPEGRK